MSRRIIAPKPRQILKASNFDPLNYEDGLAKLENTIRNGESLSPYMSRKINDMGFHDSLLDSWGIYHFHLGTELAENGNFISRTRDILLCRIDNCFAHFIKILPHVPAPWYKKELIEIIHKNWPRSIKHALAVGVTAISPSFNDQELAELRRNNIAVFLEMSDGTIYIAPGVGNTLGLVTGDGSNVNDIRFADKIHYLSEKLEKRIIEDYPQIRENARQLGFHFKEPVTLVLSGTQPDVYWDILEPTSNFQFRIWQSDL